MEVQIEVYLPENGLTPVNNPIDVDCADLVVTEGSTDLEHVRIAVVSILHHHRLSPGQCVGDAVLVLVAYGLQKRREEYVLGSKE